MIQGEEKVRDLGESLIFLEEFLRALMKESVLQYYFSRNKFSCPIFKRYKLSYNDPLNFLKLHLLSLFPRHSIPLSSHLKSPATVRSWRRKWLLTPVFWPGEFHGLYRLWGRKETQLSNFHTQLDRQYRPGTS